MQSHLATAAQCSAMQLSRCCPSLQRHLLEHFASGLQTSRALWKRNCPCLPLLRIESCEHFGGMCFIDLLLLTAVCQQALSGWIARRSQFFHPFDQNLHVTKRTQRRKDFLADPSHLLPIGIGVHGLETFSQGSAAADGYTKVVHWIRGKLGACLLGLLQYLVHPVGKPRLAVFFFRRSGWHCLGWHS